MSHATLHRATCGCGTAKLVSSRTPNGKPHPWCPHCDNPCDIGPNYCDLCQALSKAKRAQ